MQRAAKTSRFLISYLSNRGAVDSESLASHGGLLHHVLGLVAHTSSSRLALNELARALVAAAEHAYSHRLIGTIRQAGDMLMGLPIGEARLVGLYYHALAINRAGRRGQAERLLEEVAGSGPPHYRARAIQTLGTNHLDRGEAAEALRLQQEALRAATDKGSGGWVVRLLAQFEMSRIRSELGDRRGAYEVLAGLGPLVRAVSKERPLYWYFYHNELAAELMEIGRLGEAKAASEVAMSSAYASAYPEWAETARELEEKLAPLTPPAVAVTRVPDAHLPPEGVKKPEPESRPQPLRGLALGLLAHEGLVQEAVIAITITVVIARTSNTCRTIERVCDCTRTRAPPTRL